MEILVNKQMIHLRNDRISYIMGISDEGFVTHLYFGSRLDTINTLNVYLSYGMDETGKIALNYCKIDPTINGPLMDRVPQEYPSFGLGDSRQGALSITQEDGTCTVDLRFKSAQVLDEKPQLPVLPSTFGKSKTLLLTMEDTLLHLEAELRYTIFEDCDAITRSVILRNKGAQELVINHAMSLSLDMPDANYDLLTLSGAWAREREWVRRPLVFGEQSISTSYGASGHTASPFLALLRPETTEFHGEVYAAALIYSGNFYAGVEVDRFRKSRVRLGINDINFAWHLAGGDTFCTPEAVLVYSHEGLDGMSRQFHRVCAEHLVRGQYAKAPRPILLNNWEATYFGFDEAKLLKIAKKAADVGVELFVLDDGWFGHRDNDTSSLGDWTPDLRKLPSGLPALAEKIHAMGLKFGLWFEPEMISPNSDLFRAHPDWCIHINGRPNIESRNQLVLDLSRPEVCEHMYHAVANMLSTAKIDYIKWDMNRNFTCIGSSYLDAKHQQELPHRYMLGLYSVLERLIHDFPQVLFESCAGGGGRFDMGMLHYMPQTWCSDNTDALYRCKIQYDTSLIFPPFAMGAHVSAVPNHQTGRITPIATRGRVAMSGCFGYELDLNKLSDADLAEVREQIQFVKAHRMTLLYGDFHRLLSPWEGNDTAWITVAPDQKSAIFVLVRAQATAYEMPPVVKLRGLNPAWNYRIAETGGVFSGAELEQFGLCCKLPDGDAASVSFTLEAID
jgi:alpha-galactosidase